MNFLYVFLFTSLVYFSATFASSIVKRDVRHDVIVYAEGIIRIAANEIRKLQAQGRTAEATILQSEETTLQHYIVQLQAAHGEPHIRKLEAEIKAIETRIQEHIRRDEMITARPTPPKPTTHRPTPPHPTTQRPTTPKPTTAGTTIRPTTTRPITITPRPNTSSPTTIKSQTNISTIATTVSNVISIEDKLRDKALKRTAALEARTTAEIKKLQTSNKEALAAGLELQESRIHEIADELRKATQEEEIRVLEGELDRLELQLEIELNKIDREINF